MAKLGLFIVSWKGIIAVKYPEKMLSKLYVIKFENL